MTKIQAGPLVTIIFGVATILAGVFWHLRLSGSQDSFPRRSQVGTETQGSSMTGPITNNQEIITQGQVGNNTINQAPPPTFRVVQRNSPKINEDGTSTFSQIIEVVAQSPPGNMLVAAGGDGVIRLGVVPTESGVMMTVSGKMDDWFFERISNPFGKYSIYVTTTKPGVDPDLRVEFNSR